MSTPGTLSQSGDDRAGVERRVQEILHELLEELGSPAAASARLRSPERFRDTHLERDLGLGSLERVELLVRLGAAFGIHLPDHVVAEADNVGDLVEALLRHEPQRPDLFSAQLAQVRRAAEEAASARGLRYPAHAETLVESLLWHAREHPQKPHIFLREDPSPGSDEAVPAVITYGELLERATWVARWLRARGIQPGDTVAVMLPTCREFFATFLGVQLAGGVPVPIYPPFRADRIEEYAERQAAILHNAEARLLITFRQAEAVARLLQPLVPSLESVVTAAKLAEPGGDGASSFEPHRHAPDGAWHRAHSDGAGNFEPHRHAPDGAWHRAHGDGASNFEPHRHAPDGAWHRAHGDDLAFLQYTSGATGDPKGVMLTHANVLANIHAIGEAVAVRADDVGVSWLPLYHDMGLIGAWLLPLHYGIPVAVMSPLAFLSRPERWLWAVHHHRATLSPAPNFAYELCVRKIADRDIEGLDLSTWRAALNGAEPVSPETIERFIARFARYGFRRKAMLPVYGLAEATLAVSVPPIARGPLVERVERAAFEREGRATPARPNDKTALAFVSSGPPVSGYEVRIVDAENREVPEGIEGQLWFRGPAASRGYYRNPEATRAIRPQEDWIDSGDRAYQKDGEIYITGRVKDIIIKAARNLYPHEIEELAGRVHGVRSGCVVAFGVRDATLGSERLVVVAETRETDAEIRADIIEQINESIALQLDLPPDVVELVPPQTIPKTSSGKLRREATKKLYLTGQLAGVSRKPPVWLQAARLAAAGGIETARRGLRRALEITFGLWVAVAFVIFILPTWTLVKLVRDQLLAARITKVGTRIFFWLMGCPITIHGEEHIRGKGPFVFVSNHGSNFDVVLFLATLAPPYHFVSKREVVSWPFIGTFIVKLGHFAFHREDPAARLAQAEQIEAALRAGRAVLIFPEATFVARDGVRRFQLGAFKAAVVTGTPVCPIALRGMRQILRDETILPKHGRITITFCPPLYPDTSGGSSAWKEIIRLRDASREAIAAHCGEPLL
jgi:1-acyl-sn-glycerol-3-phosphate acyltransferase